jgi:hypothetical protein
MNAVTMVTNTITTATDHVCINCMPRGTGKYKRRIVRLRLHLVSAVVIRHIGKCV